VKARQCAGADVAALAVLLEEPSVHSGERQQHQTHAQVTLRGRPTRRSTSAAGHCAGWEARFPIRPDKALGWPSWVAEGIQHGCLFCSSSSLFGHPTKCTHWGIAVVSSSGSAAGLIAQEGAVPSDGRFGSATEARRKHWSRGCCSGLPHGPFAMYAGRLTVKGRNQAGRIPAFCSNLVLAMAVSRSLDSWCGPGGREASRLMAVRPGKA
jgi:hypothetical protein